MKNLVVLLLRVGGMFGSNVNTELERHHEDPQDAEGITLFAKAIILVFIAFLLLGGCALAGGFASIVRLFTIL